MPFLLERLCARPEGLDRKPEAFDETAAILAQLQRIFSTWRRNGEFVPAVPWGMQSVVELGAGALTSLDHYAGKVAEAVARYEPRLRAVQVKVEPRSDSLGPQGLVISAVFPGEEQPRNVRVAAPY